MKCGAKHPKLDAYCGRHAGHDKERGDTGHRQPGVGGGATWPNADHAAWIEAAQKHAEHVQPQAEALVDAAQSYTAAMCALGIEALADASNEPSDAATAIVNELAACAVRIAAIEAALGEQHSND